MHDTSEDILTLVAQIVSAHVAHNETATDTLPTLIRDIYQTLASVGGRTGPGDPTRPHASERVAPDHLVCRECGMTMKMLKRHLITVHGLTPDEYRAKWKLSADHPMVASNYAALRSKLAKESGLGKRPEAAAKRGRGNWR